MASKPTANTSDPVVQIHPQFARPASAELLAPLVAQVGRHSRLSIASAGSFVDQGSTHIHIPRVTLRGPETAQAPTRLGIFAAIHGDEPATATGLVHWLAERARHPELTAGYEIVAYPLVNPTGYEDGTRHNRRGHDLNRRFWTSATLPEIVILENELRVQRFDGIIALHADDTSDGLYGYAHGRVLNESLLEPALLAAETHLPRNHRRFIDGFAATAGMIRDCFPGVLSAPPAQRPQPFDLIFETPAAAPEALQVRAIGAALDSILAEYRQFIAYGLNL